ncbi:hypothetical protein [Microbacterium sp. 18062]|uniref:hypothetical protein n=1 Tax=Microbacterium sp. 18062 TaxID=2681410 RepID=UPI00135BB0EA|nr:hypothetical protein [Microbacterium sp. 18062]
MSGRVAHRWRTGLAIAGTATAVVATILAVLWVTIPPRALANLDSEVATAGTVVTVGDLTVAVPEGWIVLHPPFQDDTVLILSPDTRLETTVTVRPVTPDAAFAELADREPDLGESMREPLADGLEAEHAEAEGVLVAAVGRADGAPSAAVVARVDAGSVDDYRLAIAQLLDGMRVPA